MSSTLYRAGSASGTQARLRRLRLVVACGVAVAVAGSAAVAVALWPDREARPAWDVATVPLSAGPSADPSPSASPSPSRSPVVAPVLPAAYTLPGTRPQLPLPAAGQSTVEASGVGTLAASGAQQQVPIASVAKVMTAYVVLHDHPLAAGSNGPTITVSQAEADAYPQEQSRHESLIPVQAGEKLTQRQALLALLLPSADNAARILARWDAGSIDAFVSRMNATARRFGLSHTHYADPAGTADNTTSTAADQVKLGEKALNIATLAQIVATRSATLPLAGTVTNYNTLLGSDGVVGIKTGSTTPAGGCLLFAAHHQVNGHTITIIGAVFGQQGATLHGLPQAITAAQQLIRAAETALHSYPLLTAGQVVANTSTGTTLVTTKAVTVIGWPGQTYRYTLKITGESGTLKITGPATNTTIDLTTTTNQR
ncbi:MAG: D-alanyl-D-alanine carboxypeptidase [Micromonosporaceae bacterium]|nr:D-alanyl-D-alanine carboxypeptidase [Micromonosporaceae bacterium]